MIGFWGESKQLASNNSSSCLLEKNLPVILQYQCTNNCVGCIMHLITHAMLFLYLHKVHTDGFLNLIDVPGPGHQSSSFASIYVFAADVDTSSLGQVFYRESSDPLLLESARTIVESLLPAFSATPLTSLFIATWLNVGYFDSNADSVSVFITQKDANFESNLNVLFHIIL